MLCNLKRALSGVHVILCPEVVEPFVSEQLPNELAWL